MTGIVPSNVLVTGGAGFIGSHLVEYLIGQGCSVVVLDNFSSGKMGNLEGLTGSGKLRIVEGDIRKRSAVDEASRGIDAVVHLAALVNVAESVKSPFETHDVNVTGTLNVLAAAVKYKVQKFVFASSAAVYGDGHPLPLREECDLRPLSPYAASKVSGEYYCSVFCECYGLSSVILRFFNVYGARQGDSVYSGVITSFVRSGLRGESITVYGDGSQTRDFIDVKDIVAAVAKALDFNCSKNKVFNVCTGKPTSINYATRCVSEALGKEVRVAHVKPREGDILHSYGDPTRALKTLRFTARVGFREGLERFVESVRESLTAV